MPFDALKASFRDVNVVVTTPFDESGDAVDYDALAENVGFLREAGLRMYIPCGGASEYDSLTTAERINVVSETADAVGDDGHVVAGAGGSLQYVTGLLEEYESAGADGAMILFPATHAALHEQGLIEYYRRIADATDLGLMLYHRGDERLTNDVLAELAGLENVVAVKWATEDVESFGAAVESIPDEELVWVNGLAELYTLPFFANGAEGFTSGIANFVPNASTALMDALRHGDWDRARRIRSIVRPIQELRGETGRGNSIAGANSVAVLKRGQDLAGLRGGPVRPPSADLSEDDERRAAEYYDRIQSADL